MFPLPAARWRPPGRSLPVEDGPSLSCVLTHCDDILSDDTDIYKLMTQAVYYSAYFNRIGYEIPIKEYAPHPHSLAILPALVTTTKPYATA